MSTKPRLLDLFCGAGGAAAGYAAAGFEVVGVDLQRQPNYPFEFHQADALGWAEPGTIWAHFDAVHASPPCQAYTRKATNWGRPRTHWTEHPDLLAPTRAFLRRTGLPYVIENVPGAPINATLMLCGTMFPPPTPGSLLRLQKHRLFEANWSLPFAPASCGDHSACYNPWQGAGRSAAKLRDAQGTPWIPMSGGASRKAGYTGDLFNAIPPAYTEYIGRAWILALERAA